MEADAVNLVERALDLGQSAIVAITAGISGGILWVIRNVLTNKRELELTRLKLDAVTSGLKRIEDLLIQDGLRGREK
jgi:D-mannonate dehydratase